MQILPGKLAVAGSDGDLSWADLKRKTEELSAVFKKLSIPTGHSIIIYGHKEKYFPVAMLACIHASIPYVPVDTMYPEERIRKIASITGSQVMIHCGEEESLVQLPVMINPHGAHRIYTKPDYEGRIYGSKEDPLQYILFTSGSTGEPKGVQITTQAVQTFIAWLLRDYGFKVEDVFMNQAPFTFDISLYDLLGAFALGGSLVLNSAEVCRDQEQFIKRISDYQCSIWNSTPSFVYLYLRNPAFSEVILGQINTFLLIGEEFPNRTARLLRTKFPQARLYNAYGPTEATVATSLMVLTDEIIEKYNSLPIGYAMPGSELYIEKSDPSQKEGELIISGDHVSIGYLKNESLNSKKFFIHKGKRAFRTGDQAYLEEGIFFFLGRNDDQVKMHGFRIELDEINAHILNYPGIADASTVALKRNSEVKKIISFVILSKEADPEPIKQELYLLLEKKLPSYMIPGDIVVVSEFPYNISHKVDKNRLVSDYLVQQTKA